MPFDTAGRIESGRVDEARTVFSLYPTLLNLLSQGTGVWAYLYKEVLRLRGVFRSTATSVLKPATQPDELTYRELRPEVELLSLEPSVVV
jgi:hypothetical protein